jgi:hypothetical protein
MRFIVLFLVFFSQIALQRAQHYLDARAMLVDLGDPFRTDVL